LQKQRKCKYRYFVGNKRGTRKTKLTKRNMHAPGRGEEVCRSYGGGIFSSFFTRKGDTGSSIKNATDFIVQLERGKRNRDLGEKGAS